MKKIVGFLFALQLVIVLLYGLLYLDNLEFYETFLEDRSMLLLNFDDNLENHDFFLEIIEEKGVAVTRFVKPNEETILIYTTDVTLEGRINLLEGTFPQGGTSEFISTLATHDTAQVGLMNPVTRDINLTIAHINQGESVALDGIYYIHTTDERLLGEIIEELNLRLPLVNLFDDIPDMRIIRVLGSVYIQEAASPQTMLQMREFLFIFPVITLCLLVSLIQYVSVRMKRSTILAIHGYNKKKILKEMSLELVKIFFYSMVFIFILTILYIISTNRAMILLNFIRFFVSLTLLGIFSYLLLANLVMTLMLHQSSVMNTLKGRKIKLGIQVVNHAIKSIFVVMCIFQFVDVIIGLREFIPRVMALQHWQQTENVHRIITNGHTLSDLQRFDEQIIAFYHDLVTYHNGFIIDSRQVAHGEVCDVNPWWCGERHLLDGSNEITINPNFLKLNPIYDFEGNFVYDRLILNDYTLNVLLPERFLAYEDEIYRVFLEMIEEWQSGFDVEMILNTIHVPNDQYYFSFDPWLRVADGHHIHDPIAHIYYGRVTDTLFIPSLLTHSLYFIAETDQPLAEIEGLIYTHGLSSEIQRIESVYNEHLGRINAIQEHYLRLVGLIVLLLVSNTAVTYNLMTNYFERYKFDIFLKSTLGYHRIRRNKLFLTTYMGYSIPIIILMALRWGRYVLLVGLIFLIIDLIMMFSFEKSLVKKSISEIMKGER